MHACYAIEVHYITYLHAVHQRKKTTPTSHTLATIMYG